MIDQIPPDKIPYNHTHYLNNLTPINNIPNPYSGEPPMRPNGDPSEIKYVTRKNKKKTQQGAKKTYDQETDGADLASIFRAPFLVRNLLPRTSISNGCNGYTRAPLLVRDLVPRHQ